MVCLCGAKMQSIWRRCTQHPECRKTSLNYKGCLFVAHFGCSCGHKRTQRKRQPKIEVEQLEQQRQQLRIILMRWIDGMTLEQMQALVDARYIPNWPIRRKKRNV